MTKRNIILAVTAASALYLSPSASVQAADAAAHDHAHAEAWSSIKQAVAVLHATAGNKAHGRVLFVQDGDSVQVTADLEGLTPGQKHAMHIHQFGDCSAPDATSAGGHYNPEGHPHALPEAEMRHAGDLGNVQADDQGKAHYQITVKNISIARKKPDHRPRRHCPCESGRRQPAGWQRGRAHRLRSHRRGERANNGAARQFKD